MKIHVVTLDGQRYQTKSSFLSSVTYCMRDRGYVEVVNPPGEVRTLIPSSAIARLAVVEVYD